MKKIVIAGSWVVALLVAYLVWFVATPAICNLVPAGSWKGLIDVGIYIGVAGLGGIGLPISIGLGGTAIALSLD